MKNPERRHSFYRFKKHWLNGLDPPHPYHICLKKAEILCLMGQRQQAQDIYRINLEMAEKCGAQPVRCSLILLTRHTGVGTG